MPDPAENDTCPDSSPGPRCEKPQMKASRTVQSPGGVMIALAALSAVLALSPAAAQVAGGWPTRVVESSKEIAHCEGLGFLNATKNKCGFCTEGSTGLPANYSINCAGTCAPGVVVDCAGVCGGTAYIDECSGQCIGSPSEGSVRSFRDCRGYCTSSGGQFYLDECGVCHTGTSPFQDCTNTCYRPGFEYMMAKLVCGRCVGRNTVTTTADVLDACGNCKGDGFQCPCNGTGKLDACDVCNGGGKSCIRILSASPRAIPADTNANIMIFGAFKGRTKNVKCVLQLEDTGNITEFSGASNGTRVNCRVKIRSGTYRVGVKLDIGSPPEMAFLVDSELLVYDEVEYSTMSPTRAVFDRDNAEELTVSFSGGRVPNLPLVCIITGEGWPDEQRLSPTDSNAIGSCVIPYPKSSMMLNVAPSFNGIHPFKRSFTLEFYASPPEMRENYIAEDGHAAVIVFDRPVNLCNLKTCSDFLTPETLDRIGPGALCQWATKQQLIINVQAPIRINPLRITFLKGVLKQDEQKYALPKNESRTVDAYYPRPVSNAQLTISGPSTIPNCGMFTLVGHFSSPKGDADYYWTVYRGGLKPPEEPLTNALLSVRTTSLTLNAELLEVDVNYTFVLTAQHPVSEKYEARHDVARQAYVGPLITAYSNVMSQPSVTIDQKITLYAELRLPECSSDSIESMNLMWSVNNPRVKFNFKDRHLMVYEIQPFSLPESSDVIFTAHAYFANMLNVTSSHVVIRVAKFQLKAAIKGTVKRIVGNKQGTLVLESEMPTALFPVIYQWKCYDEEGSVCYNYMKNSTEPLLLPRDMQSRPNITIPCVALKPGKVLTFALQVFNANNRYEYSQIATTYVHVVEKNIPQVVIDKVVADSSLTIERHPTTRAYSIPAGLAVTVYAMIKPSKSALKCVKWEVKGFSSSFTCTTVNRKTMLSLEEGFLVGHGIYLIGLSACDKKGACGIANLTIHAVPGIALCNLDIPPFVEYEMITLFVKGCSIPLGRQPVTYQIFLHTPDSVFPLTIPQASTVFNIVGPPYMSPEGTQMSVEVCDKYSLCKTFPGPRVEVTRSANEVADRQMVIEKARQALSINDPLTALSLYLTVSSGPNGKLSETDVTSMLNAAAKASKNRYLNAGQLSLIYSSMLPVVRNENNKIKIQALDVIRRATRLVFGHKVKVPTSILAQGHSNAAEALVGTKTSEEVTKKVKNVLDYFVSMISSVAPLGSRIQLSSQHPGYPSSLVFRQLLDRNPIYIKTMSKKGMVEGSVRFEDSVRERVRTRPCENSKNCDGIVVALTLYPDNSPYSGKSKTTSPVLDITLRKPEDGKLFKIEDDLNAIRLTLTHNPNSSVAESGVLYRCAYWDPEINDWNQEGVVTLGMEGNVMRCWSSHLTSFVVIQTYDGLSAGSIVGIVVTVLMGVFIILGMAFFFIKKKQAASRVSSETLQPKMRQTDKLQGMNGSVVKVKTITP